jgi:CheY-like chemotaxis protein
MTSVCVIDDDADIRELMAALLEHDGYQVHPFGDATKALDALRSGMRPDVILLDLMMPKMSGWDFLSELNREGGLPRIPVAVVSGDPLAARRALDVGVAGFLKKPFEESDLFTAVRRLLAPPSAPPGAPR